MKQLGNLAIVVANHKECLLQIHDEEVTIHVGQGAERRYISCNVWDDDYINKIIAFLNFGTEIEHDEGTPPQNKIHTAPQGTDNPCIYIIVKDGLVQEVYGSFEPNEIFVEVVDKDDRGLSDKEILEMEHRCHVIKNSYSKLY